MKKAMRWFVALAISMTRQVTFDFCSSQSTVIPSATEPLDYAVFP